MVTTTANGVHISGGMGITIADSKIRTSAADGILIDNANVKEVVIANDIISNNNLGAGTAYGIHVTAAVTGLKIDNNTIGDINGDATGGDSSMVSTYPRRPVQPT